MGISAGSRNVLWKLSITEGIAYVFVGGEVVYHDKKFTGKYPGKMLRHNA